jgi:HEAT repeat protein
MLDRLIHALATSQNEAADDVLLEALSLGVGREKGVALGGLLERHTVRGLGGVIARYDDLPDDLRDVVLGNIKLFHAAIRESARGEDVPTRASALKLVALGRQGKLAYVLSENLHDPDESVSKAACEAMVGLARWAASEVRRLQASTDERRDAHGNLLEPPDPSQYAEAYRQLVEQRPEIEAAIARAIDIHRGRHGAELLRAALLLADSPASKTLQILQTTRHGGQSPMVRRLQQAPASEHVPAFLLGASAAHLRTYFGNVFAHIEEPPTLDALLRKTHWLKDQQLQVCMHQVQRGLWWDDVMLAKDVARRPIAESVKVAEWLAVSGLHDVVQDERMEQMAVLAEGDFGARLRLLQIAMRRKRGASTRLLATFMGDPDERLARMAAREIVRRKPNDYENVLLQRVTTSPESVRRIITRAIGQVGFDHFWNRFDRLPKQTRRQAGRAMLKILPDAPARLARKMDAGPIEQRIKAMQVCHELNLAEVLRQPLMKLCQDPNPKLRSKAVSVIGSIGSVPSDLLIDRLLNDTDARVRANTIEVLEANKRSEFLPVLAKRARATNARERANAIKALHHMRVGAATGQLQGMLRDDRSEHRISAMWALRQIGWWKLLNEVGRIAKEDPNQKVRRYALAVLRNVAEMAAEQRKSSHRPEGGKNTGRAA